MSEPTPLDRLQRLRDYCAIQAVAAPSYDPRWLAEWDEDDIVELVESSAAWAQHALALDDVQQQPAALAAQLAEAQRERDANRNECRQWADEQVKWRLRATKAEAEASALREALAKAIMEHARMMGDMGGTWYRAVGVEFIERALGGQPPAEGQP